MSAEPNLQPLRPRHDANRDHLDDPVLDRVDADDGVAAVEGGDVLVVGLFREDELVAADVNPWGHGLRSAGFLNDCGFGGLEDSLDGGAVDHAPSIGGSVALCI